MMSQIFPADASKQPSVITVPTKKKYFKIFMPKKEVIDEKVHITFQKYVNFFIPLPAKFEISCTVSKCVLFLKIDLMTQYGVFHCIHCLIKKNMNR